NARMTLVGLFALAAMAQSVGIEARHHEDPRWSQWNDGTIDPGGPRGSAGLGTPLPPAGSLARIVGDNIVVDMFVGETRIFSAPDVARVAVGDGSVIHAAAADQREVVVFARTPGTVSLVIWSRDGASRNLRINVIANDVRRIQSEVAGLLERIPNARSSVVGDKLIIEGDDLSDADQARIAELARRYPQVVDFTGQVGWDRMVLIDVQVV